MIHTLLLHLAYASSLLAAGPVPEPLEALVRKAPLIFEGEVVKVEYRSAKPSQLQPRGLPHTFVTYKVLTPVFGKTEPLFTLRLLGGANPDGTMLDVDHYPTFDVGERDVLLIEGNTTLGCPLAGCALGRLRVSQGKVFSDSGRVLRKGAGNRRFAWGSFQDLPEALTRTIVHPKTGEKVVVTTKGESEAAPAPEADQLKTDEFLAVVRELKKGQQPTPVPSADIRLEIPPVELRAVAAPAHPKVRLLPPKDQAELEEQKKIDANGGDPVIKQ